MDKATIQTARQANLAEYLLSVGVPLVRSGARYRHKDHDSLVFTKNMYYWNSRQEHGNAIDYLVDYMNMTFVEAVLALINVPEIEKTTSSKIFDMSKISVLDNQDKVRRYLYKTRDISNGVINHFTENGLLLEEERTNNAIFPMYDENNSCVGAEVQGIKRKRFKGVKSGSKYGYGFNVGFSDDNTYDYALFFESAIDLMSFTDYKWHVDKKNLDRCLLISMAGLKTNIVKHTLETFKGDMRAILCVDNDTAGLAFKRELAKMKIPYAECSPAEKYKDWNDQLKGAKQKPISRLLNRGL
jgi:hypothetical protein